MGRRQGALLLALAGACMLSAASAQSIFSAVSATPGMLLFTSALRLSGLEAFFSNSTLSGNLTVFAPNDAALYAALPALNLNQSQLVQYAANMAPVLAYHAIVPALSSAAIPEGASQWPALNVDGTVSGFRVELRRNGSAVRVLSVGSDATVVQADLANAGSSVVHVVDQVLFPFYTSVASAITRTSALSTLAQVATFASPALVSKLQDTAGNYTVFAPYNAAFTAALSSSGLNMTLAQLAAAPALVQSILSYHVVPGLIPSASFSTTPTTVTTLTGQPLTLVKVGNSLVVVTPNGNATLLAARDLPAGFTYLGTFRSAVHVIDRVLVPPPITTLSAALSYRSDAVVLLAAIRTEGSYAAALNSTTFSGTLLVPSDAAFASLLAANGNITAAQLLGNTAALKKILDAHVVPTVALTVAGLVNGQQIVTSGGVTLTVNRTAVAGGTQLRVAQSVANVVGVEIPIGTSATVILLDSVLLPANVTLAPTSGGGGGAATAAVPSLALLAWSVMAAAMLFAFSSH